jgi:membrane dipeptidase
MIVDSHLDLAWNALYNGRDLRRPLAAIRDSEPDGRGAMTSLPDLGSADVGIVFATLFAEPVDSWIAAEHDEQLQNLARPPRRYSNPAEAEEQALEMLDLYRSWESDGAVRIITSRETLEHHVQQFERDQVPGFVILMEGADPIRSPEHLQQWWDRGLRMISLAWGSTRYAGGTGSSTGLSAIGNELVHAMAQTGVIHDTSHLSEEAFWDAIALPQHAVCTTHTASRDAVAASFPPDFPANRFLTDGQLREVAKPHGVASSGVVGLMLISEFLDPSWYGRKITAPVTLAEHAARHLHHMASVIDWENVAIGSDVDTLEGAESVPDELDTIADWSRIADAVPATAAAAVLGENWLRFLRETLPAR